MTSTRFLLRSTFVAAVAVLGLAVSSQAGVIVTQTNEPALGLPTHRLWTLTAHSDNGAQIVGFDFASQQSFGFFGSMNQVNPFNQPTIFADNNPIITGTGGQVSQDSQFKYLSSTMTVPAGFASESNTQLRALFASAVGLGTSTAFVQLAIPNAAAGTVGYVGEIQTQLAGANPVDNRVSGLVIPEPASSGLLCIALLWLMSFSRNRRRDRAVA